MLSTKLGQKGNDVELVNKVGERKAEELGVSTRQE